MCLSKHPVQCSFQTNRITLKQRKKFKYLGVAFSSDVRQDNKLDKCFEKASTVMRQLYQSVVLKRELYTKAKLSVFRSVFVPILTYGHECWVMTERGRSPVQVAEMGVFQKVRGLFLIEKVKSTDICQSLNTEPLLLRITISTTLVLPCDTNVPRANSKQPMDALPSSKRPRVQPTTRWRNYIEDLAWLRLGIPPAKLPQCLEIPTRAAAPSTLKGNPKRTSAKRKIHCTNSMFFPENDNNDELFIMAIHG